MHVFKLSRGGSGWMIASVGAMVALAAVLVAVDRWFQPFPSTPLPGMAVEELATITGCDPAVGNCVAVGGDRQVTLGFGSAVVPLESFTVDVNLRDVAAEAVTVEFRMEGMEMGINRFDLVSVGDGGWRGKAVLPVCWAGRRQWTAVVFALTVDTGVRARFGFTVVSHSARG